MSQLRVVTGVDLDGGSVVVENGPNPNVVTPMPGLSLAEQWMCERVGGGALDVPASAEGFMPEPPAGGVLFRLVTFPPDPEGHMHKTETVDLVAVVSGEIVLALEGGEEITLRPGDTVVQRGATHAWRNKTDAPATIAVTMVSAAG